METGTTWCLEVGCDGEVPWTCDGGEVYLNEDEDGNSKCPKCGTNYEHKGEDWEVSHVYMERRPVAQQEGAARDLGSDPGHNHPRITYSATCKACHTVGGT